MATSYGFASPAHVQVLLVPVGQIKKSRFKEHAARLQQHTVLRLGDVTPDSRPHNTMFSPLGFPEGLIMFDFSTTRMSNSPTDFSPFEVYQAQIMVIGIADGLECCQDSDDTANPTQRRSDRPYYNRKPSIAEQHEQFLQASQSLRDKHTKALVCQILVFDHPSNAGTLPEEVISVPTILKSTSTTIKTVMCDLAANLLSEMTRFAKSVQALPTIETPVMQSSQPKVFHHISSSPRPVSVSLERGLSSSANVDARSQHRASMPPQKSSSDLRSSTPELVAPSRGGTPPVSRSSEDREQSSTRSRSSVHGFGAGSSSERERIKGKARIGIVIGSLYLLAGRWPDALKELSENATVLRAYNDYVWLAKALDYLLVTTTMYAWADFDFRIPQLLQSANQRLGSGTEKATKSKQSDKQPVSELPILQTISNILPEVFDQIFDLYDRAIAFTEDKPPMSTHLETAIRAANALTVLHHSNGILDKDNLQSLIMNTQVSAPKMQKAVKNSVPGVSDIGALLMKAVPDGSPDNLQSAFYGIQTMCGIISSFARLGQLRKQGFLLKGLASLILPALVIARKAGAAEMGVHPAASISTITESLGNQTAKSYTAQGGMRDFLRLLCDSHGIYQSNPSNPSEASRAEESDSDRDIITRIVEHAMALRDGSQQMRIEILRLCINICEALPDIGGVMQFSAKTLQAAGSGIAPSPEATDVGPNISAEDQIRLSNNITRTISLVRHLNLVVDEAEYWDDFLVRSVTYFDEDSSKALKVNHSKNIAAALPATKNPFIHDAFAIQSSSEATESVLVADEIANFRVTLQNLYEIELIIESIRLEGRGMPVDLESTNTYIGPCRTQTILLNGTPRSAGDLVITGCIVKVQGCRERRFPIFHKAWTLDHNVRNQDQVHTEANGAIELKAQPRGPEVSQPTLKIIQAQPSIVLYGLSSPHSSIMLLEGEKRRLVVTLHNTSSTIPADLLLLSFDDSVTAQFKDAISNRELTALELHELELSVLQSPALEWIKESAGDIEIPPNGHKQCTVDVLGKPGLSAAEIRIDFAYLGIPKAEVKERFYTRKISIPLTITVNASLELTRNDLLPVDYVGPSQKPNAETNEIMAAPTDKWGESSSSPSSLGSLAASSKALLVLDFRNSWPAPLTLNLVVNSGTSPKVITRHNESIAPGHICRVPLLIPKMYIPSQERRRSIPSLSAGAKRQYVVSSSNTGSPGAELAAREIFWYRQGLLDQLQAEWEEQSGRRGSVNLRSLRLSSRMLDLLKLDDLEMFTEIRPADGEDLTILKPGKSSYRAPLNTFLSAVVSLRNRSSSSLQVVVRFDPRPSHRPSGFPRVELSRGFVWNGTLHQSCGTIKPGVMKQVRLDFCVITEGSWRVGAEVEEVAILEDNTDRSDAEDDWALNTIGPREKRIWKSEGCEIVTYGNV